MNLILNFSLIRLHNIIYGWWLFDVVKVTTNFQWPFLIMVSKRIHIHVHG